MIFFTLRHVRFRTPSSAWDGEVRLFYCLRLLNLSTITKHFYFSRLEAILILSWAIWNGSFSSKAPKFLVRIFGFVCWIFEVVIFEISASTRVQQRRTGTLNVLQLKPFNTNIRAETFKLIWTIHWFLQKTKHDEAKEGWCWHRDHQWRQMYAVL